MKIQKKSKKKIIIILSVILVIILSSVAFASINHIGPFEENTKEKVRQNKDKIKIKKEKQQSDNPNDADQQASSDTSLDNPGPKTTPTEEPINPSTPPEVPLVTRAEQSGDYIRVAGVLKSPSNGTCTLRLEKAGHSPLIKQASVVLGPSYYTCDGFRIAKSELPSLGSWTASITHTLNNQSSISELKTINVQ